MDTVVRNVCWLSPPEPPIFANTPKEAKERMLNIQQSSSVYNYYTEHCLGKGNGTIPASPAPTSTPSPTTFVSRVTSSPVLTTEFTNISSQQNDTIIRPKPELINHTSDSGSSAVIPVIVTFVVILLLATIVVAVWYIKKKKGSGYRLFIRVQNMFLYKDPSIRRNRESSSSSNGSKKSRNNSAASESGVPNNGSCVVITSQVSMNEKDFKHASTAQLIDQTSIKSEYENPTFGPVMEECESFTVKIEMEQKELFDTQVDSDVHKSNSISPNHKALHSSDYSDNEENDPPYDTPPKRSFKEEQRDQSEDERDKHLSMEVMEGAGVETSETEKVMENLKPDLNIDQNSNTEVSAMDKRSVIKNQPSMDSGYETHVHSPSPNCV